MLLIRRAWLIPAFFVTCVLYFIFLWPADPVAPATTSGGKSDIHWLKRAPYYPVTIKHTLPSGASKVIPKIQHDFKASDETATEKQVRERRRDAVGKAFQHTWDGYRKYAWGKDELAPVSGAYRHSFGGWGATLVDSLSTLWIMGMNEDFVEAVDFVQTIDWTTNTEEQLNVFETTIRYLGGLLSAYDLSEHRYPALLDKAKELGELLFTAFDTPNHLPVCRWQWMQSVIGKRLEASDTTLLAEFGSLSLEFTRLSQLTGDMRFYDAITRISHIMAEGQNSTSMPGLWPTIVNAKTSRFEYNHFTMGGMADSTYEYLPKQYLLLGGNEAALYQSMYTEAIESAKQHLFFRPMLPNNTDVLYSGNTALTKPLESTLDPQGQHLTCFIAGMVGIAARIFSRPSDLDIAQRLLEGCIWAYSATPSGLMPETFHLVPCRAGVTAAPPNTCDWSEDKWYTAIASRQGSDANTKDLTSVERGKFHAKQKQILPGFTDHGDNRYILRPEAIESVFNLYRITGDKRYQDVAWTMWTAIERAAKTDIAFAALHDVRIEVPQKSDRMESFWLAETLKYFYLIFDDTNNVNLDEWVLNTEAHPLRRPA